MTWKKLEPATRIATIDDELFTLRAILINILTEVQTVMIRRMDGHG